MLNDSCLDVGFEYFKNNMKENKIPICVRNKQKENQSDRELVT